MICWLIKLIVYVLTFGKIKLIFADEKEFTLMLR